MATFKAYEDNYHRASQAINRHINGLQLGKVEALAAQDLPSEFEEAEQYVRQVLSNELDPSRFSILASRVCLSQSSSRAMLRD